MLLAVLVGLVPCSTRPSERRCNVSHHQRCHNKGYCKNQKYALHYLSPPPLLALPFPKNKTGHQVGRFLVAGTALALFVSATSGGLLGEIRRLDPQTYLDLVAPVPFLAPCR